MSTPRGRRRATDDTGSLPLAMLLIIVGVTISALLVPLVVTQIGSTRQDVRRVHSLDAAQTGVDAALGHIRAAVDAAGTGVLASLPCGPLAGSVGVGGTARYQVTIDYLQSDPVGQSDVWVTANRLTCTPGVGPSALPRYALLRADGTDSAAGAFGSVPARSVRATYTFQTAVGTSPGGAIRVSTLQGGPSLCLDAGSATPVANTTLLAQPCGTQSAQQLFVYGANLTIVLGSSRTSAQPLGMCLDAGSPQTAGGIVRLQPCAATTKPQQQWSVNAQSNVEGTADGLTLDGLCFNMQAAKTAGSAIVLGSVAGGTCRQAYDSVETFFPDAAAGAGAAGATTNQLVNFGEYGRCVEVTNGNPAYAYLIADPCQQAPDPTNVGWGQRWVVPAIAAGTTSGTGLITTDPSSGRWCLLSPGSLAAGQYPTLTSCPAGVTPQNMTWTIFGNTGVTATSYRITDGFGYCLSVTDPAALPPDLHPVGYQTSKIIVARCDGTAAQKWNAPQSALQAVPLKDISER